jgi:hypothetical protein
MDYKKIQEIWKNKRYRSLLILGGYLIFFMFLGSIFSYNGSVDTPTNKESGVTLNKVYNFEYKYKINYLNDFDYPEKEVNIEGKHYLEKDYFTVKETGESYYFEKNKYYNATEKLKEIKDTMFFDITLITPINLSKYLEKATLKKKNEDVETGMLEKEYELKIKDYLLIYDNEKTDIDGFITIKTYTKDNKPVKAILDLTNFGKVIIEANYSKLNKVEPFYKYEFE